MKIFTSKTALTQEMSKLRQAGQSIGFVPTMGALHQGHLSLLQFANQQNNISVVSIFVNPTQFNNPDDLKKYPKTIELDKQLLEAANCDYVFIPDTKEMYPENDLRLFDFGTLATVMEGKYRQGHFNGVGQIVSKLFDIVSPDRAYFGQKDFQQVAIIHKLVDLLDYNIEIISCPIVREDDGLAMSSRNLRLTTELRSRAPVIYKTLVAAAQFAGILPIAEIKEIIIKRINIVEGFEVEYLEIVDEKSLIEPESWGQYKKLVTCIAVFCGEIRLIDNIVFNVLQPK